MAKNFLDENGFLVKRRPLTRTFTVPLEREEIEVNYFTDSELYAAKNSPMIFDLEIYPNYFLAAFQHYYNKKVVTFEIFPGREVFNYQKLLWVMHNFCLVGFNSLKFDIPILWLAMTGATVDDLHQAVFDIIVGNMRSNEIEMKYRFKMGVINTIDLIEVAPLSASLKAYGSRLHTSRLQDLPFDPAVELTPDQAHQVKLYCINDLAMTAELLTSLEPQLNLRVAMGKEYGLDLRSKSDPQIAETVICSEIAKLNGKRPKRPKIAPGTSFKYQVPNFVSYKTPLLQNVLKLVRNAEFVIKDNGQVQEPPEFKQLKKLRIGSSTYTMGIGGLHSTEEKVSHKSDDEFLLIDRDVASYYPAIILNQRLYPSHMGESFLTVYQNIVTSRLEAKRTKNKVVADSLKICVNGSFGKLGSKYSNLYSPDLMFQVTVSGQLCLLMMIERIENLGVSIVSGNTDGIIIRCPQSLYGTVLHEIKQWGLETGFETEETQYTAVYSRDVNNYIAIKTDGSTKLKGAYSKSGLSKNPTNTICNDAVIELVTKGSSIEDTIHNCKDITKFVTARNVKGGGEKNGIYLGKIVRWYYAENEKGTINYVLSGNKVPKSEGGKPLMDLPPSFPNDIDYQWYINETISMLYDIGYLQKPKQLKFF